MFQGSLVDVSPDGGVTVRVGGGSGTVVHADWSDIARIRYAAESTEMTPTTAPETPLSPVPPPHPPPVSIANAAALSPGAAPSTTSERHSTRVFRLAPLGAYRQIDDLSSWSAGAMAAFGSASRGSGGRSLSVQLEVRALAGRTGGGLSTYEAGCGATVEFVGSDGFFGALGGGLALFDLPRATRHGDLGALGLEAHARVGHHFGYRFGEGSLFGALDIDGQLYLGSYVVGPSLIVGYTF